MRQRSRVWLCLMALGIGSSGCRRAEKALYALLENDRPAKTAPGAPGEDVSREAAGDETMADGGTGVTTGATASVRRTTPPPLVLGAGSRLRVTLETGHSSASSKAGDRVVARLAADMKDGDRVALPAGSELRGRVVTAVPSGRVKGRARLVVSFDRVVAGGKEHAIETSAIDVTAKSAKKRDAAMIGGGAGLGAIVGAIAGGKKGAAEGALLGAGAGTGAVLATKGEDVKFPAGSEWTVELRRSLEL